MKLIQDGPNKRAETRRIRNILSPACKIDTCEDYFLCPYSKVISNFL